MHMKFKLAGTGDLDMRCPTCRARARKPGEPRRQEQRAPARATAAKAYRSPPVGATPEAKPTTAGDRHQRPRLTLLEPPPPIKFRDCSRIPADEQSQRSLRLMSLVTLWRTTPPRRSLWRDHVDYVLLRAEDRFRPEGQHIRVQHSIHLAEQMEARADAYGIAPGHPVRIWCDYIQASDRTTGAAMRTLRNAGLVWRFTDRYSCRHYALMVGAYTLGQVYEKAPALTGLNYRTGAGFAS